MRKLTLLVQLLLSSILLQGEQPKIDFYEVQISIDGKLDEPIWMTLPRFSQFFNCYPQDEGMADNDTEVKIFHNGEFLYISAAYKDNQNGANLGSLKRDDYHFGLHLSDSFGVIIDPYGNQNRGYFFAINSGSNQVDGLIGSFNDLNTGWNAIWQAEARSEGNMKYYEIAIPLSSLSFDPNKTEWNLQFYTRDPKNRTYTAWSKFPRTMLQFDTRYLKPVKINNLRAEQQSKTMILPSLTSTYFKEIDAEQDFSLKPSLDVQHSLTQGLRLDLTINPDFSQVDVDQQVTNLSRFDIVFPEQRNFFLENSDLFAKLGTTDNITPFYSRFIGAETDILFGLKLSGNISPSTRIGLLEVQSSKQDSLAQNYAVAVAQQQFSEQWTATGYLVNRQKTKDFEFTKDYNRVFGSMINYLSKNKVWWVQGNYSKAMSPGITKSSSLYNIEAFYDTPTFSLFGLARRVEKNYLTDIGFVPRIYNYDPEADVFVRQGYNNAYTNLDLLKYYPDSKHIDSWRYLSVNADLYYDDEGKFSELNLFANNALWFKDLSSIYLNFMQDFIHLKYGFDPLGNGQLITPGDYQSTAVRLGYYSDNTQSFYYSGTAQAGSFYHGKRQRFSTELGYRILPYTALEFSYELNRLDLNELGKEDFHLVNLIAEVFFSNTLSITNYVQYNTQFDNFNVNSRLEWQYRPLSYVYLVFTDNFNRNLKQKEYGVSLKLNYRLQL